MSKQRYRIALDAGTQTAELFSALEKPDGTINIFHKKSSFFSMKPHKGSSPVIENRTTLHTSTKSKKGGKTFVRTIRLADGRRYRSSAYVIPNSKGITWLLSSFLCQDLELDIYKFKSSKDYKIIVIDKTNTRKLTLVYHIVATSRGYVHDVRNINSYSLNFSMYTLTVYWLYLAVGSTSIGRDFSLGTSLMTVNGFYTQLDPVRFTGCISPNSVELSSQFNWINQMFQKEHAENVGTMASELGGRELNEDEKDLIKVMSGIILVRPPLDFLKK